MKKREARFNDQATPLITIVVNHRSRHKTLQKCLESILGQSYPNIEVILYDFGTKDGSWECALSYQQKYPGIITLLRTRIDFAFDPHVTLYTNIRGRYFIVIDSAVLLNKGTVSLAVAAIKKKSGCAYVLMGNNNRQERERFYAFDCEVSGFDHLKSHLLSVPYPGSSIALYDTDIAKIPNSYDPYIKQANLCFKFSVVSISEPQFDYDRNDEFDVLYPHFISLCNQKIRLIGLVEKLYDFTEIDQMKDMIWERFALELMFLSKNEVDGSLFRHASMYFYLAMAQYPYFIEEPWYNDVHNSIVNKRPSSFWENEFQGLYSLDRFSLVHESMVPIDEK